MTHITDEPQAGGLIDRYWILSWIIMPIFLLGLLVGCFYVISLFFRCPYIEDVSSCFPYNLPTWLKLMSPIVLIISIFGLLYVVKKIREYVPDSSCDC